MTWLPNQLMAVMDVMCEVWTGLGSEAQEHAGKRIAEMMANVYDQKDKLDKEVRKWCQERDAK